MAPTVWTLVRAMSRGETVAKKDPSRKFSPFTQHSFSPLSCDVGGILVYTALCACLGVLWVRAIDSTPKIDPRNVLSSFHVSP
jgi:hypothetical protein